MANTNGTDHASLRADVEKTFAQATKVIQASFAPVPALSAIPGNEEPAHTTNLLSDIRAIGFDESVTDVDTLCDLLKTAVNGVTNDRDLLLEHVVQLAAGLPATSKAGGQLSNQFINTLWDDLSHPPTASLGEQYKYREADGSYNNIRAPMLGAANTPYARSARPEVFQPISLPDPGDIFDSLMERGDFIAHPNGVSSMLFYLATIIIHDL